MKKIPILEAVAATSLVTIAICALMLVAPGMKGEVAAAWAQAILTTAGIGFALYTAHSSQEHAERLKLDELLQLRQGVIPIAEAATHPIRVVYLAASENRLLRFIDEDYQKGCFDVYISLLRTLPLHGLSSYPMTVGIMELINILSRLEKFFSCRCGTLESPEAISEAYSRELVGSNEKALLCLDLIRGGANGLEYGKILEMLCAQGHGHVPL